MLLMQHHQDGLYRRLSVIGIPTYSIGPFVDLMVKWEKCSGVEWTIKRLKGLKVDLLRRAEGLPPLSWVRKNRHGDVYGILGSLFRWSDTNEKNFSKCVQAFNAYTYYILPSLTEGQKEKFLSGINPEKGDGLDEDFHKSFSKHVSRTLRKRSVQEIASPLVTYVGSSEKKAPTLSGKSVPQSDQILLDLKVLSHPSGLQLFSKYRDLYDPLLRGLKSFRRFMDRYAGNSMLSSNEPVKCGSIHFLQEPGGKLRSIASPFRIHQEALRPFGRELYLLVKSLPWDCTFDQTKAIPSIQSHLRQGGQVHSIDLSSATDHFPLSIQETALRAIFPEDDWKHIDLFIEISRGSWSSPIGDLQWTKGQPLGLYPSFGSFTLTHGLLLHYLAGSFDHQFYVVGDDVVILDDELRDKYVSMLERMGCPWSSDKSLSSNKLAEFAGKIITQSGVIPQLKWRKLSSDNFLDICRLLGPKSRCLLNKRQKRVFDRVAHLCEPIGLNQSLPGDNLSKMVERTLDFYSPVKAVLGSLMGLRKKLNQLVHTPFESDFDSDELNLISTTFDEKVKSALTQTLFANWDIASQIGLDAFSSLPEALDIQPRLPLKEFSSVRKSTLERYEGLLHRKSS